MMSLQEYEMVNVAVSFRVKLPVLHWNCGIAQGCIGLLLKRDEYTFDFISGSMS